MSTSGRESRFAQLLVVFGLGAFGLAAQTLLFRQFLTVYEGNELGIGAFFSSWLVWVALGAAAARLRLPAYDRLTRHFQWLALLYIPALALQQVLILHSRTMAGVAPFEMFPFTKMFPVSMVANAPVSFVTGFLFSLACAWTARGSGLPVARVYIGEALGSFAGGIVVTLLLARGMTAEAVLVWMCLVPALFLLVHDLIGRRRPFAVIPVALVALVLLTHADARWAERGNRAAWSRILPAEAYRGSFATAQGKYLYGEYQGQFNVLAWESVAESVPDPEHASEVMALTLAQKPDARSVLVLGPGSYSLCLRLLDLPRIESVSWLAADPDYPAKLLQVLPQELRPGRDALRAVNGDARAFVANTTNTYDLAILNLPDATTLALNRYSTAEFFALLKKRLTSSGVMAVRSSGGANFMGEELIALGASIHETLKANFRYVVLKPGDETWFIASDAKILSQNPDILMKSFAGVDGAPELYPPAAVPSLYPRDRAEFQFEKYAELAARTGTRHLLNTDHHPRAMLHSILFLGRHAGSRFALAEKVRTAAARGYRMVFLAIGLYALLRASLLGWTSGRPAAEGQLLTAYDSQALVLTTGMAGLSVNLVLMFLFQSRFGSIFLHIGLISSLFMLGLSLGNLFCERLLTARARSAGPLLALAVAAHAGFCVALIALPDGLALPHFAGLIFAAGLLGGPYVPLAALQLKQIGLIERSAGSRIEMCDTLGGAVAGLLTGLVLLPVFGTALTLGVIAVLLCVNLVPFVAGRHAAEGSPDRFARVVRPAGHLLFGVALLVLAIALVFRPARPTEAEDPAGLLRTAQELVPGARFEKRTFQIEGDAEETCYRFASADDGTRGYVFDTARLAPHVYGYSGRIEMVVAVDQEGRLLDFRLTQSRETSVYADMVTEWAAGLRGRNVCRAGGLSGVDAVSGATITSTAFLRTLEAAGTAFAAHVIEPSLQPAPAARIHWRPDKGTVILLPLFVAAVILRRRGSRRARLVFLVIVAGIAGFYLNAQYSLEQVLALLSFAWPATGPTLGFLLVVGVPVFVLLFGNVYCGYLCPFGALQELAGELCPASWRSAPSALAWRWTRALKYLLLFAAILLFARDLNRSVVQADPLVSIFSAGRSRAVLALAAAAIGLSFLFGRFWCRNLCPTGAFLSILNRVHLLRRWIPRVPWRQCDYGVASASDLDCICCDRCRGRANAGRARSAAGDFLFVGLVVVFAAAWMHMAVQAARTAASPASVADDTAPDLRRGRDADEQKIRKMIRSGRLSEREALYYRKLEEQDEP